jgi:hypothetical protein
MSRANMDVVRSICAARERGDYSDAGWAHPDIEYVMADGPAPATWRGKAEMAAGVRDFLSTWKGFRGEVDGYQELDLERVLLLLRFSGRGKSSPRRFPYARRPPGVIIPLRWRSRFERLGRTRRSRSSRCTSGSSHHPGRSRRSGIL